MIPPSHTMASMFPVDPIVNDIRHETENGGDKLVHGSGGISQPRAE